MTDLHQARLFDTVEGGVGVFSADHPRIDDAALRDSLLDYLEGSSLLRVARGRLQDVVDPSRGTVVPISVRTDGEWTWSGAAAYYLREHGLSPDPALVAHAEQRGFRPGVLSDDELAAVVAAEAGA